MTSDKGTGAMVVGIPIALAVLVAIWVQPGRRPATWGALSFVIVILAATGVVAALRGGGPAAGQGFESPATSTESSPTPTTTTSVCSPSGPDLRLVAKHISFNVSCLAAPANSALRISLDNQDPSIGHSFHILTADPTADPTARSLFKGKIVTGPATFIYRLPSLPQGTYYFQCDVHHVMNGTFIVQ